MTANEGYVTREEAARLAGVHFNTIRLWERTGRLHPRREKRGDRIYVMIAKRELQAIIDERGERYADLPGGTHDQVIELREVIARLETEIQSLRDRLDEMRDERDRLMSRLLDTRGEDDGSRDAV